MKMSEFNLLEAAGLSQIKKRSGGSRQITNEARTLSAKLAFDYYDGNRKNGYGGYVYDGRWQKVAKIAKERYNLNPSSKVLIDRCHKGFLVYDLTKLIPGITVFGLQPKAYTLIHAMDGFGEWALVNKVEKGDSVVIEQKARQLVHPFLIQGDSRNMPFENEYFDTVISIENACAYPEPECRQIVREIMRISKDNGKNSYIQNDSWKTEHQKQMLIGWTLLCKTFLSTESWAKLFQEEGYNGDWGFTIIE